MTPRTPAPGSGDQRLTAVLDACARDLLAYLRRRCSDEDAADLLVETMTTAWRRASDLPEDDERARMWMFVIARNGLLNHRRGERRRSALAERLRQVLATGHRSDAGADAGAEVQDAIARLEPGLAELVRLIHWEGFSVAEAGELCGIAPSTARARYRRAREELRRALGAERPPPG